MLMVVCNDDKHQIALRMQNSNEFRLTSNLRPQKIVKDNLVGMMIYSLFWKCSQKAIIMLKTLYTYAIMLYHDTNITLPTFL